MPDRKVNITLSAQDKASEAFKRLSSEAEALKGKLSGLPSSFGSLFTALGAGALGSIAGGVAFSGAIKNASDFEYALFQTTKVTKESTDEIRQRMLSLPASLGSATDLTKGYYQTISAGVTDAAKAMEMLKTASKLASVAEVSQGEAIQALSKMMAGYQGEIKSVADASDMLLDIEQLGQASVKELIPVIGDLSGVSKTAGVSYKEMAAALALITQTAGSPSQAATQFRALEMSLLNTNETMQKVVESLGVKTARELVDKNGLAGALKLIKEASEASELSLAKVYGSSEAFSAANALAANSFRSFSDNLSSVGSEAGRTEKSFSLLMQTFTGVEKEGVATFTNLLTIIGQEFLPSVKGWLQELNRYLEQNTDDVAHWGKEAAYTLSTLGSNVKALVDLWKSIPEDITGAVGYGVVGAALFGKTGAVLGLATSLIEPIRNIGRAIDAIGAGDMKFSDFAFSNSRELKTILSDIDARKKAATSAASAGNHQGGDAGTPKKLEPPKQAETKLPSLPAGYKPVAAKGAKSQYSVDKTASALENLEAKIRKLTMTDELFREWELTNVTLPKLIKDTGGATAKVQEFAEAQRAAWAKDDAEKALKKQNELNSARLGLLRDVGNLTGNNAMAVQAETEALEAQAESLIKLYPELEETVTLWKEVQTQDLSKRMITGDFSTDFSNQIDLMADRMREWFEESQQWGEKTAGVLTGFVDDASDAFVEFIAKGKSDFSSLIQSMLLDLAKLQMRKAMSSLVSGTISMVANAFAGGGVAAAASGRVFSGGDIGSYSNSIVTSPTFFGYGRVNAFADGAGLMGEAGPEAVMPLTRMGNGNLGVQASLGTDFGRKLDRIASLLASQQTASSGAGTSVVLVDDQRRVKDYLLSTEGQKTFIQLLNRNRSGIQNVANGGRA